MKPKEKAILLARLSALAQETRLDVFYLLAKHEPQGLFATDIAHRLKVPKNTMSTHFRILEEAGLIRGIRDGRTITYRAEIASLANMAALLVEDVLGRDAANGADNAPASVER